MGLVFIINVTENKKNRESVCERDERKKAVWKRLVWKEKEEKEREREREKRNRFSGPCI